MEGETEREGQREGGQGGEKCSKSVKEEVYAEGYMLMNTMYYILYQPLPSKTGNRTCFAKASTPFS